MSEHDEGNVVNIYAQLDSQEMPIPKDLSDYWQDPSSYFLISGDLRTLTLCLLMLSSAAAAAQPLNTSHDLMNMLRTDYNAVYLPCTCLAHHKRKMLMSLLHALRHQETSRAGIISG